MFELITTRFHEDHRRRGWFSIFPMYVVDVNVVVIPQPGIIVGWHRHYRQDDYWFVPQGTLQVGVFDHSENVKWVVLSSHDKKVLKIPREIWHGYKSLEPNTILIYGLTNIYDGSDEERKSIEEAGINWNLGAK